MKPRSPYATWLFLGAVLLFLSTCKEKEDPTPQDPEVNHTGEKWNIKSASYSLIDQNLTNGSQAVKNGIQANAGAFYFNGASGSFDVNIDTYHKEDYFSFSDTGGDISITSIAQTVSGATFSQYVIVLSGDKPTPTTMSLTGVISRQTTISQFVLTATFELEK